MARIAEVKISHKRLNAGNLSASLLSEILENLPYGTIIKQIYNDYGSNDLIIRLESDFFKDMLSSTSVGVPEIIVNTLTGVNGEEYFNNLDLGAALDTNVAASPKSSGSIPAPSVHTFYGTPLTGGTSVHSQVHKDHDKGTDSTCSHKWKWYFGLSEKFEYCDVCQQKKK